jgi:signal peptidase I
MSVLFVWRWLTSRTVREATMMRGYVWRLIQEQRDVLAPQAVANATKALDALRATLRAGAPDAAVRGAMTELEQAANKWLQPYPNASWRENVVEFQGTAVKLLAVFCFFFQPMAIPSGSAQPTLYGITYANLMGEGAEAFPPLWRRLFESCVHGVHYYRVTARVDGELRGVEPPKMVFPLIKRQRFMVGSQWHSLWLPTGEKLAEWAELYAGKRFKAGEDILRLRVVSGDHLFVNRWIYNFTRPERGEIVVFTSTGIPGIVQDTHYIKRLVALGGERVRIGDDRHLVIDGQRLDASTPGFESVYSFKGPPQDSVFSGHVNGTVNRQFFPDRPLAPLFPNAQAEFQVRPNHYLAMGDNTCNSHDGRSWGDFPREKVIGRASFVFWPISSRFGLGYR